MDTLHCRCATCDTRLRARPETRDGVQVDLVEPCPTCCGNARSAFVRVERVSADAARIEELARQHAAKAVTALDAVRGGALRMLAQAAESIEAASRALRRPVLEAPRPKPARAADTAKRCAHGVREGRPCAACAAGKPAARPPSKFRPTTGWPRRLRCAACSHVTDRTKQRGSMPRSCPSCSAELSPEMAA